MDSVIGLNNLQVTGYASSWKNGRLGFSLTHMNRNRKCCLVLMPRDALKKLSNCAGLTLSWCFKISSASLFQKPVNAVCCSGWTWTISLLDNVWDLAGQGDVETIKQNYCDLFPHNKQPGNTAIRKRMNRTDLVEMSGDTKIIIHTLRRALQHFIPQQRANQGFLRQATKAGKKLLSRQSPPRQGVSHAQNICLLPLLIQELWIGLLPVQNLSCAHSVLNWNHQVSILCRL